MGYTNCLMVSQMKELDLFDNIPYKYIKNIIEDGDYDIEVEIRDLECDIEGYCKTRFTFEISQGKTHSWDTKDTYKKFVVEAEYNGSSCFALLMCGLDDGEEDEDEDDDE